MGMGKKRNLFLILLSLSFLFLAAVRGAAAERAIKVGIIDTYTGPAAVYGQDALNGFKLALAEINKKGVLGKKVEFSNRDDKFKVDVGLTTAKELVMNEKVDLLVGTINSGVSLAVSDYARGERIPFIVWISKTEKITGEKGHRYAFCTAENTHMAGKAGGLALSRKPYLKYWIAGDDYEYGHAVADAAWHNLKRLNPKVELLGKSWWKVGEPDLIPYITAILAVKPDAVIFASGGASMTNVLKTIKNTGLSARIPVWIHTATDHAVIKPLGLDAPEGVMGTMDYHFYHPDIPANRAFVKAYQKAYKNPPGFPAFHAYLTAQFIAKSFEKAGSVDREKFVTALEGMKVDSPIGEVEMRACDHQAVLPLYMGTLRRVPQYNFLISTDIVDLPGKEVLPTCEEVKKIRGGS